MNSVRNYLLSIVAACMISAIGNTFVRNRTVERVLHLVSGVLILLTVVSPLLKIRSDDVTDFFRTGEETKVSAEAVKEKNQKLLAEQVQLSTEKHIETIAAEFGFQVRAKVEVRMDDLPQPCSVELIGAATSEQMKQLSDYIETGLAIPIENQTWRIYETDG